MTNNPLILQTANA